MTLHHYRDEHGLDTTMIANPSDEPGEAEVAAAEQEDETTVTGTPHGH
jgi:hypothetical protein